MSKVYLGNEHISQANMIVANIVDGVTLSNDTVSAETLVEGYTAHDSKGKAITGTNPYEKNETDSTVNTQAELIAQIQEALIGKEATGDIVIGGGGAEIGTILNDDGTQSLIITDKNDTVEDLTTMPDEIDTQTDLIAQIKAELDAKAEGGGGSGSGGNSSETCTVTLVVDAPNMDNFTVHYLNNNYELATTTLDAMNGGTFTVAKDTIIAITPWMASGSATGGCTCIFGDMSGGAFIVSGDGTLLYA